MNGQLRVARAHLILATGYLVAALLSLLDFVLSELGLAAPLANLRWLRIHLVTVGVLTQAVVGVLPLLLARRLRARPPATAVAWSVFGLLNAGLLLLVLGQLVANPLARGAGGLILLVSFGLWLLVLAWLAQAAPRPRLAVAGFYLAGPIYLVLGVLMALTLMEGWPSPRGYQAVKESHIHANIFGFTGLVVAGLALDLVPLLYGRDLARPRWVRWSLGLMAVGAFGLWLGPYIGSLPFLGGGMALYLTGTVLMLGNVFLTVQRPVPAPPPQGRQLLASYIWVAAPVIATLGFVVLGTAGLDLARLEYGVAQGLVYGWILQLLLVLLPVIGLRLLADRWDLPLLPGETLGASLIVLNAAVAVVWLASIALPWPEARLWVAIAYVFVAAATVPGLLHLVRSLHAADERPPPVPPQPRHTA